MPITASTTLSNPLQPSGYAGDAREEAVKLGASLTLAKGTVMAKKTSDGLFYPYDEPDQVQTVAIGGTLSAGGYRIALTDKNGVRRTTALIAYNAVLADVQTAINVIVPQESSVDQIVVGGTVHSAMTLTFSGNSYDDTEHPLVDILPDGLTGLTSVSVTDSTTRTGLDVAKGVLVHKTVTDGDGRAFLSDSTTESNDNRSSLTAQIYVAGQFDDGDLTGWDAGAAVDLKARTLANGDIRIP